ncbi:MAG: molybdopterin-binding protein, partial [Pseudomonadota bacterium]
KEVRVVSDDRVAIVSAVQVLAEMYDSVFTSGGIGPTHDDITADAIAAAFGAKIDIREDARAILAQHYTRSGTELNEARLRMARIPDGAALIENPISAAPGFILGNVHVMAGVPSIFQAMLASVIPTLTGGDPLVSRTIRIERPEGEIAGPLGDLAERFPNLSFGSYPFIKDGVYGANVVIRGTESQRVDEAAGVLSSQLGE